MDQSLPLDQQYSRFISWQCRLRKLSMRQHDGRPSAGMSAGIYSISGGEEKSRMNFLIVKQDHEQRTAEFQHIIRKSQDPAEWVKNGLRILAEYHYQEDSNFARELTASFGLNSNLADALLEAGQCGLKFAEASVDYEFKFSVESLQESDSLYQATYWHNHLFNPTMPGRMQILRLTPMLD